jgi:hypothetical protein
MTETPSGGPQTTGDGIRRVSDDPMLKAEGLQGQEPVYLSPAERPSGDIVARYRNVRDDDIGRPPSIQGR